MVMRVFKTKWFARFARQERIGDDALAEAIRRAEQGLIDADLGGGLVKQRVARAGRGRSAGYRTIVAYSVGRRAVFLLGFAKSEIENIRPDEVQSLRRVGQGWLSADAATIRAMLGDGSIQEVEYDEEC
jgi:hypothetical protein